MYILLLSSYDSCLLACLPGSLESVNNGRITSQETFISPRSSSFALFIWSRPREFLVFLHSYHCLVMFICIFLENAFRVQRIITQSHSSGPQLRRTCSFDRTWKETVAESVANELLLHSMEHQSESSNSIRLKSNFGLSVWLRKWSSVDLLSISLLFVKSFLTHVYLFLKPLNELPNNIILIFSFARFRWH